MSDDSRTEPRRTVGWLVVPVVLAVSGCGGRSVGVRTCTAENAAEAAAPAEMFVDGVVFDAKTQEPIHGAGVFFAGADRSGFITDSNGRFRTFGLGPGTYSLFVSKDGYHQGDCEAHVADGATPGLARCALSPLPRVSAISGTVRDAATSEFVELASARIIDPKGRSLTLTTDRRGSFRFENVPAGRSTIVVEAAGYSAQRTEVDLMARKDENVEIRVERRGP